jgi:rhodanese-related sulfurtransferase
MFAFLRAFKRTDPAIVLERIATGEMTLIDVREAGELKATGCAEGAINLPLGQLRGVADPAGKTCNTALSVDKPVALYCATGARSAQGVMTLRKLGYSEVHNLGGLGHWQAAGGALKR